jgi:hypothetical protein
VPNELRLFFQKQLDQISACAVVSVLCSSVRRTRPHCSGGQKIKVVNNREADRNTEPELAGSGRVP